MYHPEIIERRIGRLHSLVGGAKLIRYSVSDSIDRTRQLIQKRHKAGFTEKGKPKVVFTRDEQAFMRNEVSLSMCDFRYFANRYGYCEVDGSERAVKGAVAPAEFWESQERALDLIAERELTNYRNLDKHGYSDGIHVVWHKTRQQGATAIARLITAHRMVLHKGTRSIVASIDQDRVDNLYKRDKDWLDNLPFFMAPQVDYDRKSEHIMLAGGSNLVYHMANQTTGIGTAHQFDCSHMTEVSLWPYPDKLQFDFLPAVPKSPSTFVGFESTANGKGGFWYKFTESIRKREPGFQQWVYVFTPCYINARKNRLVPPDDWTPSQLTIEYADVVERTSHEHAGRTIRPDKPHLYWWETEYLLNRSNGTLHLFFSNYPSTPEESFQYNAMGALPVETIQWMRSQADIKRMMPYSVRWTEHDSMKANHYQRIDPVQGVETFPQIMVVGSGGSVGSLERMEIEEIKQDPDPRGIVWMREPPQRNETYIMGIDPTQGRTGWSRAARVNEDKRTNNGSIQVLKQGKQITVKRDGEMVWVRTPDVQVCEYAAPIDAFELGYVANILGRLYAGTEEDQCECILEVYPGPGSSTMRTMTSMGYTNFWRWQYYADLQVTESVKKAGWTANLNTVRDLWLKCSRHLINQNVRIYSPWLVDEYSDARMNDMGYAEIESNEKGHGDRMRAFNLAIWAANKWDMSFERTDETVALKKAIEWQASDMSLDEITETWADMMDRMIG